MSEFDSTKRYVLRKPVPVRAIQYKGLENWKEVVAFFGQTDEEDIEEPEQRDNYDLTLLKGGGSGITAVTNLLECLWRSEMWCYV